MLRSDWGLFFGYLVGTLVVGAAVFGAVFGFGTFALWAQAHPGATAAVAASVFVAALKWLALAALTALSVLIVVAIVRGVAGARKQRHANHRFEDESTAERIIVARYSKAGDRDVVLNVGLNQPLWLAPDTDADSYNIYPFVALINHAPLYLRSENESRNSYTEPMLHRAHTYLWTSEVGDKLQARATKRERAERAAIRRAISAGAVELHVDAETWEPAIPGDAKFRTHWKWAPPADPATA